MTDAQARARLEPVSARVDSTVVNELKRRVGPGGDLRGRGIRSVSAAVEAGLHRVLAEAA